MVPSSLVYVLFLEIVANRNFSFSPISPFFVEYTLGSVTLVYVPVLTSSELLHMRHSSIPSNQGLYPLLLSSFDELIFSSKYSILNDLNFIFCPG